MNPKNNTNPLERFCFNHGINLTTTMNGLMDAGLVSDNAVTLADVAEEDWERAGEFLEQQKYL